MKNVSAHGLLGRVRELGIRLISVSCVGPGLGASGGEGCTR